tara:strand:- start:1634 stop:2464 length:831 start_codon:yes stop_codon:yes gene_type:complete
MEVFFMGYKNPLKLTRQSGAMFALLTTALAMIGTVAAETSLLREDDTVGASFWIATAMMFAATAFFIMERGSVAPKWRTSMTVAALVTGVAWYHYTYMREAWAQTYAAGAGQSPLVLRYVDWLITVPLQVAEFYLILAAVGAATAMLFWRLFGASLIMLISGYLGEAGHAPEMPMLVIGCIAWFYIMYEVWAGDAKKGADTASEGTQFAFRAMAIILTVGWAIYPIGYFMGTGDNPNVDFLNILYNLADSVNKVAFGLMVWYAATMDTKASASAEE